jgi:hypothetical protein
VESEASAVGRAEVADFFFDGVQVKISANDVIWDIPRSVHDHARSHIKFKLPGPSSRFIALWPTKPLSEMSTRNFLGVKRGRNMRLTTSPPCVSRVFETVVFNLGFAYSRGYAKTSYGLCKIEKNKYYLRINTE